MPLRNRVHPTGEIVAVPHRGTMMGNRGRLHDENRDLVRTSQLDRWLVCQLSFRGRRRSVMAPRRYTELFFLDEASALAAGHRPCAECRHRDYQRFRTTWRDAGLADRLPSAPELDAHLALDRRNRFASTLAELPDGVLVLRERHPHLLWRGLLWRWAWTGYHQPTPVPDQCPVEVLTPLATTRALRAGYPVLVHPSAAPEQRRAGR